MKSIITGLFILSIALTCSAAKFPDTALLWKNFQKTEYSDIHASRVFVRPVPVLNGKQFAREKKKNLETRARYKARCDLRNRVLNRIFADFVPGEKAVVIYEKYDLYHEAAYETMVVTSRMLYFAEIHESKKKGAFFRKYDLNKDEAAAIKESAAKLKNSDGSCRMTDSKNYPSFISVAKENSSWEIVVVSASRSVWTSVPEIQKEYFRRVSKVMNFMAMLNNVRNSKDIPPIIVKKK